MGLGVGLIDIGAEQTEQRILVVEAAEGTVVIVSVVVTRPGAAAELL